MEEYLEKLLSQIRCKKARPYIEEEYRQHLEDQICDYLAVGMDSEEAEKMAVVDMGDPIVAGISLDRVHKPRVAWQLLLIIGIVSLLGILIQQSILYKLATYDLDPYMQNINRVPTTGFFSSVMLGLAIMCVIYFIDYTFIARCAKLLGGVIVGLEVLGMTGAFGWDIKGMHYYVGVGAFRIAMLALIMFYIPIYGAILYKYRGGGVGVLLKAICWLVIPVWVTFRIPSIVSAGILFIILMIQLTFAVMKGWFRVPIRRTLVILWSLFLILPAVLLFGMYAFRLLATYQVARIQAFLSASGDGFYLTGQLRALTHNIALLGDSGNDVLGTLPNFNSDYIFTYIINSYGSMAGIVVIAALAVLVMFAFAATFKQKNELGMAMGLGCSVLILLNVVLNLGCALGFLPPAATYLPFISFGRSNICLNYALLGVILSIYRYKDVYPKHTRRYLPT